jgi:hypothetical protein
MEGLGNMKFNLIGAAVAAGVMALVSTGAHAADCNPSKTLADDMTPEQAQAVYDCLKDGLYKGYNKNAKAKEGKGNLATYAKDFRDWTVAAKFPAAPGFHGSRFLMTYVNSVGADEYLKYKDENVNIPAGTVIAKESFKIGTKGKGKARKGPLFLMEKLAAGTSPKTMDWQYTGVLPNGKPMKFNPVKACSKCHMENFAEQGGLGYPIEEARIGN